MYMFVSGAACHTVRNMRPCYLPCDGFKPIVTLTSPIPTPSLSLPYPIPIPTLSLSLSLPYPTLSLSYPYPYRYANRFACELGIMTEGLR